MRPAALYTVAAAETIRAFPLVNADGAAKRVATQRPAPTVRTAGRSRSTRDFTVRDDPAGIRCPGSGSVSELSLRALVRLRSPRVFGRVTLTGSRRELGVCFDADDDPAEPAVRSPVRRRVADGVLFRQLVGNTGVDALQLLHSLWEIREGTGFLRERLH